MKLALLVAFSEDRRSARILSAAMPMDEAIKEMKALITADVAPDASRPLVTVCSLSDIQRKHSFKVSGDPGAEVLVAESDEIPALLAENARLTEEVQKLGLQLAEAVEAAAEAAKVKPEKSGKPAKAE
jgi:hypothetical protein